MSPMLSSFVLALALVSTSAWATESHCSKDEVTYFSCYLKNSKVVSICGNVREPETADDQKNNWIQYRFGRIGQPELVYPDSKVNSVSKFEGNYFNPHGEDHTVLDLRFINKETLYSVELVSGKKISGFVNVELSPKKRVAIACREPIDPNYSVSFFQLMGFLSEQNGNTDFLNEFYKLHQK